MKFFKNKYFFAVLIFASLISFAVNGFFYLPHSDDYLYANWINEMGWWKLQSYLYFGWSGRYSSTAIIGFFNPLNDKRYFFFSMHVLIGLFLFVFLLYKLILEIFKQIPGFCKEVEVLCVLVILYFYIIPGISDGIFWYTGMLMYFLSVILFIWFLLQLYRIVSEESKIRHIAGAVVSGCFIVGFNEVILMAVLSLSFSVFFIKSLIKRKISIKLGVIFFFILSASLIEIVAPGNYVRAKLIVNEHSHSVMGTLYSSLALGISHIVTFCIKTPMLLLGILLIIYFLKVKKDQLPEYFRKINPVITVMASGVVYFSTFSPGAYAGLGNYSRTLNISFFVFVCGFALSLFHFSSYFFGKYPAFPMFIEKKKRVTEIICWTAVFMFLVFTENNLRKSYSDLLSGKSLKSFRLMNERKRILELRRGSDTVRLKYIHPENLSETIYNYELCDEKNEYNKPKLEVYYKIKSIEFDK